MACARSASRTAGEEAPGCKRVTSTAPYVINVDSSQNDRLTGPEERSAVPTDSFEDIRHGWYHRIEQLRGMDGHTLNHDRRPPTSLPNSGVIQRIRCSLLDTRALNASMS